MAAEDNNVQDYWQSRIPNVNLNSNIFGTDADGQPLYQTMFMPPKPGAVIPSNTNTPVAVEPSQVVHVYQPADNNPNVMFEHEGGQGYTDIKPRGGNGPVSRVREGSAYQTPSDLLKQQNDPNSYHEDPEDPAGSAIKYIAGPPSEENYKKASDNAKKIGLIADALRHIGNIINTSHYAPAQKIDSTFDYLDKRERIEKAQRQAEEQKKAENDYRNFKKQISLYDQQRKDNQAQENTAYRQANLLFKAKEDQRQEELQPDKVNTGKANADAAKFRAESAGYDALSKKIKTGYIKTEEDLKIEAKRLGVQLQQAQIAKLRQQLNGTYNPKGTTGSSGSRGRSGGHRGVSKGSGGQFTAWDEHDKPHTFKSASAANTYAKQHGTYVTDFATTTSTSNGRKTTTVRPNGGHPGHPKKPKPSILTVANNKTRGKSKKF